jgi:hypothetical protein
MRGLNFAHHRKMTQAQHIQFDTGPKMTSRALRFGFGHQLDEA